MPDDALVIFTPSGRRGRFPNGTTVLDAARSLGVDIDSVCGGRGICGRCQVTQGLGEFPKHGITSEPANLSEFAELETAYRAEKGLADDRRLSCTATLRGDVLIDVPPESQVHRQVVRKGLDIRTFIVDPVVRLHYVEVTPPELASPSGDLARLFEALEREWALTDLEADLEVVRALQPALQAGAYGVTVAVHHGREVIGIWPGLHETAYGVAIDVGSTTIAGHLANLADGAVLASNGVMNPQIRFGEDLMSRVSYAMMHPEGAREMTVAVRKALDGLIASLAMRAGIKRVEILELAIVGNPIMHHLLLGIDPTPLGGAPFALATDRAVSTTAAELGLRAHPGARVYVLPCIAGHVGADTAGVILAEEPHEADRMTLVVDVGTNAEIVLGDKRRLLAASSPTGPAFEGAQISGGQRASPGAIERVRIDRSTLEPRFRIIGVDAWSDEPAFPTGVAGVDGLGITGICGSGIIEVVAEMFLAGIVTEDFEWCEPARQERDVLGVRGEAQGLPRQTAATPPSGSVVHQPSFRGPIATDRRRRRSARASCTPPRALGAIPRSGNATTCPRCEKAAVLCGNAMASTKCCWKRGSTAVSIFSTRRTTASISVRAAPDSRAMSAPVPAALPADRTWARSQSGMRPRIIAWVGSIWLPNAPARRISSTSSIASRSMSSRTPAYSAALASWIARTSFWVMAMRGPLALPSAAPSYRT